MSRRNHDSGFRGDTWMRARKVAEAAREALGALYAAETDPVFAAKASAWITLADRMARLDALLNATAWVVTERLVTVSADPERLNYEGDRRIAGQLRDVAERAAGLAGLEDFTVTESGPYSCRVEW